MMAAPLADAFLYLLTFVKSDLNMFIFLYFFRQIIRIPSSWAEELNGVLILDIDGNCIHRKYYRQQFSNGFLFFKSIIQKGGLSHKWKGLLRYCPGLNVLYFDGRARSKKSEDLQEHLHGEELMEHTYSCFEADSGKWGRL